MKKSVITVMIAIAGLVLVGCDQSNHNATKEPASSTQSTKTEMKDKADAALDKTKQVVEDTATTLKAKSGEAAEKASELTSQASDKASELADKLKSKAKELKDKADKAVESSN